MNELINHGGDCRTAPATPGLLNTGITLFHIPYVTDIVFIHLGSFNTFLL